jgi:predicted lipoprotein with Yx(FWY)xxD motif
MNSMFTPASFYKLPPWVKVVGSALAVVLSIAGCHQTRVTSSASNETASPVVPNTTPTEITTVDVVKQENNGAQPEYLWTRLGDASGRTLLELDASKMAGGGCTDQCAQDFQPVYADDEAMAFDDWSLVASSGGKRQWAYQGSPLFTSLKERKFGELVDNTVCDEDKKRDPSSTCERSGLALPPGWQIARLLPAKSIAMPPLMSVRRIPEVMGYVFVNEQGRTLYVYRGHSEDGLAKCNEDGQPCATQWEPYSAGAINRPLGPFGIQTRADGERQWTYMGQPLYTFAGDNAAGEVNGQGLDFGWTAALRSRDFLPDQVRLEEVPGRGIILATQSGHPLYTRHQFRYRFGGRNLYHGFGHNYAKGKELGTQGCDPSCLQDWKPLIAADFAVPSGYWELMIRPDGARQWAYEGDALYTNVHDSEPKAVTGNNLYEYLAGSDPPQYSLPVPAGIFVGGAGMYWHVGRP